MSKFRKISAKKVFLLDTGKEWGGGTVSMIELIKRLDPVKIQIVCCFYNNYRRGKGGEQLSALLEKMNIPMIIVPKIFDPFWVKILKESLRILFFWSKNLRACTLQKIDIYWRIKKRTIQIINILNSDSYDLVYLNNQPSSNLEAYFAAECLNIPVVQHSRIDVLLSKFEINIVNKIAKSLICNSHGVKKSLINQGINSKKLSVVYNGFEVSQFQSKVNFFKKSSTKLILGTVSSLIKRKSIHHIIDALEICRLKHNLDAHLIIVGEGPEHHNLIRYAKTKQMINHVTFAGFSENPISWIKQMDIFIFASNREGFGRAVVEAMLCKRPVIAANSVGPNEIVVHGKTGFLYPYGDINKMVFFIIKLVRDKKNFKLIGDSASLSAIKRFSMENYIGGVTKIIEWAAS
jgi:glycosyltransferase involved in cell wall biosynthesis